VLVAAAAIALGCSDDSTSAADKTPDGASDFTSFAPGDAGGQLNASDNKAGAAAGGSESSRDGGSAPKVEEGDVARVWGTKLLVLNRWRGLQIIDLADPKKPALIGRVPMHGVPREMYVAGDHATVLLSQVHSAKLAGGKVQTFAGSELHIIKLGKGSDAKTVVSLSMDGWISASKRIDDRLVLITADTGWSPWYWGGCYGPYPCAEAGMDGKGGVATGSASAGGASEGGVSTGDAAVMGPYGYNAQSGKVVVYDQKDVTKTKLLGSLAFTGGMTWSDIAPGEVLLHGSEYSYDKAAKKSWRTDRLQQITIGADGKPQKGATWQDKVDTTKGPWRYLMRAARLADGRLVLVHRAYGAGGNKLDATSWKLAGGKFEKTVTWSAKGASYWSQAAVIGDKLVLAGTLHEPVKDDEKGEGGDDKKGDDEGDGGSDGKAPGGEPSGDPDDDPPDSGSGSSGSGSSGSSGGTPAGVPVQTKSKPVVEVVDLAKADTITVAGLIDLGQGAYVQGAITALPGTKTPRALLGWRDSKQTHHLDTLALSGVPTLAKGLAWSTKNTWWTGTELLDDGTLLVGTQTLTTTEGGGKKGEGDTPEPAIEKYTSKLRIVKAAADGTLAEKGSFSSKLMYWSQLRSIVHGKLLLRAGNQALEIIDIADLAKPAVLATLELAANVRDVAWLSKAGHAVAMVNSWLDGKHYLRTISKAGSDELNPVASIAVKPSWARMYTHGDVVWLADYQGLYGYDFSAPDKPKAVGTWKASSAAPKGYNHYGWSPWDLPQKGATLFALARLGKFVPDDAKACENGGKPVSGGGSAGSGSSSSGSAGSGGEEPPKAEPDKGEPDKGGSDKGDDEDGDKGDPGAKEVPGGKDEPGEPTGPKCTGKTVWTTYLRAISVADAAKPAVVGELKIEGAGWYWGVRIAGDVLYMTHYQSLKGADGKWFGKYWLDRVDISDPAKPALLDQINVPGRVVGLSADGKYAFTVDWQPAAGSKPEQYKVESWLNALQLHKGKAYLKSKVKLAGHLGAHAIAGDRLYVGSWQYPWTLDKPAAGQPAPTPKHQLHAYDIADPAKMAALAAIETGAGVTSLTLAEKTLFAGIGWGAGLLAIDVSKAKSLLPKAFLPVQGSTWRVVAGPGAVYVPTGYYGLVRHALEKTDK